jgi:hypothetical protein
VPLRAGFGDLEGTDSTVEGGSPDDVAEMGAVTSCEGGGECAARQGKLMVRVVNVEGQVYLQESRVAGSNRRHGFSQFRTRGGGPAVPVSAETFFARWALCSRAPTASP